MNTVLLRAATPDDAPDIARVLRDALSSFRWMPVLHTPAEDLAFVAHHVLPQQQVTVAEVEGSLVGFVAVEGEWVQQLYLEPKWTGRGIGRRLLADATRQMPFVKLRCFQANAGARRFYEREGFGADSFGDGSTNEEGLPDILFVRRVVAAKPVSAG